MATRREKRLQKAEKLVQRGKLEAAIEELHKVLKESPDDTRTLNRVGDLYARLNRVDEAAELFSKAAERFSGEGFFVKAIAIYKKILRLDPTRIPIYERLAELYQHQGLSTEARGQYQILADYFEKEGDAGAVISVYEKLAALDPRDSSMRQRLAELLAEHDRIEEALEAYSEAVTLMIDGGEPDEALPILEQALDAAPEDLKFVMRSVVQLQSLDRPELVERFLAFAEERNPEAATARSLLEQTTTPETDEQPDATAAPEGEEALELVDDEEAGAESLEEAVEQAAEKVAPAAPAVADEPAPEFEIELEAFEETATPAVEPAALDEAALDSLVDEIEVELAADDESQTTEEAAGVASLEEAAPEPAPEPEVESVPELLAEADALAGYGLDSKASERLTRALELEPGHLGAYRRLIHIESNARRDSEVVRLAAEAAQAAIAAGAAAQWREIVADLERGGYRLEGSRLIPPPPLELEVPSELFVDAPTEGATELEAEEATESAESATASAAPAAVEGPPAATQDEAGDWLESLDQPEGEAPEAPAAASTAGESEFFDLGAELEMELGEDEDESREAPLEAQTVEEIVEGFKKGMAEVLSPEAFDTHYNLGVAYREMGLIDEAIGEFQLAAKDPRYLVECCSLLGQCFQEKDFADLALKWYRKGLESPHITEEATLGLLYEVGNLQLAAGDRQAARDAFAEIYGADSTFRDVVAKLEELRDT